MSTFEKLRIFCEKKNYAQAYELVLDELSPPILLRYSRFKLLKLTQQKLEKKLDIDKPSRPIEKKIFTVITINLNNLAGLKKTIDSVINQNARSLIEYCVIDGESSDGSLEYLNKVSSNIDVCVFGKDSGIYDAMNRGIELATGSYCIFMNSGDCFDDQYVVQKVKKELDRLSFSPDSIYGDTRRPNGTVWKAHDLKDFWKGMKFSHQSVFISTKTLKNQPFRSQIGIVADFIQLYKMHIAKARFYNLNFVVSSIEDVGISEDFYARTCHRWMAVREISNPAIDLEKIDGFYRSLLNTQNQPWNPSHEFEVDNAQNKLIPNIQKRLIFLISMPRSGSTLLQKILEQSDQITSTAEPWVMLPLLSSYDDELIEAKYVQKLNIMAKNDLELSTKNLKLIEDAQQVYADSIYSSLLSTAKERYFLDKTPRYIYILDRLAKIYPEAKYIVLTRNPAAVISSYAHTWFKGSYQRLRDDAPSSYDFERGFKCLADFVDAEFKNKFIVRYEDLVSKPQEVLPQLFDYLRISFKEKYITYGDSLSEKNKYKLGDPTTVYSKQKPDFLHVDKWITENEMNGTTVDLMDILSKVSDSTISRLGYDRVKIHKSVGFDGLGYLYDDLKKRFGCSDKKLQELRLFPSKSSSFKPTLGVVITSYNNCGTILTAIESVIRQSRKPEKILIADDHSTDDSVSVIKQFITANPDKNIKLIERTVNVGVGKNRDLAIREIDTDYVTTLDGDDVFAPTKLEAEYLLVEKNPGSIAFSNICVRKLDECFIQNTSDYSGKTTEQMVRMLITRSVPVPRDMLFPKSIYEKAGGFDHELSAYEDWALKCRMMAVSEDFSWLGTGLIGTIYDRRWPGLSQMPPIFHVRDQLLAIARNIEFLNGSSDYLAQAIRKISNNISGPISERMKKFADYIDNAEKQDLFRSSFKEFFEKAWGKNLSTQSSYEAVWRLANIKQP